MAVKDPAVMLRSMNHLRVRGAVLAKVVIAAAAILLDLFVSGGVFTRAEIGLLPVPPLHNAIALAVPTIFNSLHINL
jgi:hypothetical protein